MPVVLPQAPLEFPQLPAAAAAAAVSPLLALPAAEGVSGAAALPAATQASSLGPAPREEEAAQLPSLDAARKLGGLGALAGPRFDGAARLRAAIPDPGPSPSAAAPAPRVLLARAGTASARALGRDLLVLALAGAAGAAAVSLDAAPSWTVAAPLVLLAAAAAAFAAGRARVLALLGGTPGFGALYRAESLFGLAGSRSFAGAARLLMIALREPLREGRPVTAPEDLPGKTALERRYWFLKGEGGAPTATVASSYRALRENGLPAPTAFVTALLSHLLFGPKSQRGMSEEEKRAAGIGPRDWFKIHIPTLIQAQGYSNTRVYAAAGNAKGLAPGDVDMGEFEDIFRLYAGGRGRVTAKDLARMREGNRRRDELEGRGTPFSRWTGLLSAKRRADQLMLLYADRVVEEDGLLVPAVSRGMLLRVYQGTAHHDLLRERGEADRQ